MCAQRYKRNVHIVEHLQPGITLRTYMRSDDSVALPRFHVHPLALTFLFSLFVALNGLSVKKTL